MIRLLLDENLPRRLKLLFPVHIEVFTVNDMGWTSKKNGDLLRALEEEKFDGLITSDRNLVYQQNLKTIKFIIFVLKIHSNRLDDILPLLPALIAEIDSVSKEKIRVIG